MPLEKVANGGAFQADPDLGCVIDNHTCRFNGISSWIESALPGLTNYRHTTTTPELAAAVAALSNKNLISLSFLAPFFKIVGLSLP